MDNLSLIIIIVAFAVVVVGVVAALLGRLLYVRQVKRSLVSLLGKREGILAAARGLELVLEHLLAADDATLGEFASDPASEDRHALEDIAQRMRIAADDLHSVALPKRLWTPAERMERAARIIAAQAGGVGEAATPELALAGLATIRMDEISAAIDEANTSLEPLMQAFDVRDPAVYGGGLYI